MVAPVLPYSNTILSVLESFFGNSFGSGFLDLLLGLWCREMLLYESIGVGLLAGRGVGAGANWEGLTTGVGSLRWRQGWTRTQTDKQLLVALRARLLHRTRASHDHH